MAQEYILIKEKNAESGLIALSKNVFELISKITVDEIEGVHIVENTPLKNVSYCKITNNKLSVILEVKVKYGINVNKACEKLQEKICQNIALMTNLKCHNVDIKVNGFIF